MSLSEMMSIFKGALPATLITGSSDGVPNVANISRIWYVDDEHLAVANQFLNKTAANLEENGLAMIRVVDPGDLLHWDIGVCFIRSESEGALYERINHDLKTVSWMAGKTDSPDIRAAMLFRVTAVRKCVEESHHLMPAPELYGDLLQLLAEAFEWERSSYWVPDETADAPMKLIASRGVPGAGVGESFFEPMRRLAVLVGVQRSIVRLSHIRSQLRYMHTIRSESNQLSEGAPGGDPHGLEPNGNFLGIPIFAFDRLIGVVCCEGTGPDAEVFERHDDQRLMLLSRKIGEELESVASIPADQRGQMFRQVIERTQLEWAKAIEPFHNALSARERQVSIYVAKGHTNAEIAKELFISTRTVTTHLERIFQKLQVNSRAALTRYIVEKGFLGEPDGNPR